MMYAFMTLNDGTEIVHSEMKPDGRVKVYMEQPDDENFFNHATCWLPDHTWEDIVGFDEAKLKYLSDLLQSTENLIWEYAQFGGIFGAADL